MSILICHDKDKGYYIFVTQIWCCPQRLLASLRTLQNYLLLQILPLSRAIRRNPPSLRWIQVIRFVWVFLFIQCLPFSLDLIRYQFCKILNQLINQLSRIIESHVFTFALVHLFTLLLTCNPMRTWTASTHRILSRCEVNNFMPVLWPNPDRPKYELFRILSLVNLRAYTCNYQVQFSYWKRIKPFNLVVVFILLTTQASQFGSLVISPLKAIMV